MKSFKRTFLVITCFASSLGAVTAQLAMADQTVKPAERNEGRKKADVPPPIVKENQTVYLDSEGKTYVNKSLPIYLKFSTTPDGKNYDLKSQQHPEDAEPMYLDTEGVNYIRSKWAVDAETKQYAYPLREVQMELYADSKPPVINSVMNASAVYRKNGITYYGRDLAISFKVWDEQSGVKKSFWSLNNGSWNSGDVSFADKTSGEYVFNYYAVDNVNNYADTRKESFVYDQTPPSTSLLKTEEGTFVFGPKTKVQFDVTEEHSGIKATYFRLVGVDFLQTRIDQVMPATLADGEYNLSYYSVDNVGNGEDSKTQKIYLDKIAPETILAANKSFEKGSLLYVSPSSEVSFTATDNKAGVKNIIYSTRGHANEEYVEPFGYANYHGWGIIRYRAEDVVGNRELVKEQKIFVDSLRPTTNLEFVGDYFEVANRFYVNESTKLKFNASDAHSGVGYTEYASIGSDFEKYDEPFSLKNEGYNGMMYRSVDNVDNAEYSKSIDLYLDKKGPEIVYNFSNQPIADEDGVKVYPAGTRLFLGATDDQSGTNTISYKINNQAQVHYSSPKTIDISEKKAFKRGKLYEVSIVTTDLVNNQSDEKISFKIED